MATTMVLAILVMSRITIATKTAADKCRALAAKGWCDNHDNRRDMYYQCELKCDDICSSKLYTTDPSKDKIPTCVDKYSVDHCDNLNCRESSFIRQQCMRTCEACLPAKQNCYDEPWCTKTTLNCKQRHFKENCKLSCGECTDKDECSPTPCVHGRCTDLPGYGQPAHLGPGYKCTCDKGWAGHHCDTDCFDKKPCTCAKSYTFSDSLKRNECTRTTNCNKRRARFVQKNCKKSCGICPVNGNWGEWSEYSSCSKTCGRGQKSRSRSCDNPASSRGGADCPGKGEMNTDCNTQACPVNGNWGEWSKYTPCSNPCGGGQKSRSRSCDNPAPAHGGKDCPGEGEMTKDCNTQPCPVNGNWGCWSDYSSCSKTCGGGKKNRSRLCDNPAPAHGGKDCIGKEKMTKDCNTQTCDVDECKTIEAPCNKHGKCTNTDGSYTCDCGESGYTGDRCETDVDECKTMQWPCNDHGKCTNTNGSYTCDCESGYTGDRCKTDIDECKTIEAPCNKRGKCTNTDGNYTCDCTECGYKGDRCEIGIYNYTNGKFCYAYVDDKKNWNSSKDYCLRTGGYLAEPRTEAQNTFIKNIWMNDKRAVDSMWLGGYSLQQEEGTWTWVRSNTNPKGQFTYWAPNQPDVYTGPEGPQNCMIFWNNVDKMWDNQWCVDEHVFLCQRDNK